MIVVKNHFLENLAKPISLSLFGYNKTWRGFIILPFLTALLTGIFNSYILNNALTLMNAFFLGFGLGFSYMLWELPNSYAKRKLGIANGAKSKQMPLLQAFTDKADSIFGVLVFYYWFMPIMIKDIIILFIVSLTIHIMLSYLLYVAKIKKSY